MSDTPDSGANPDQDLRSATVTVYADGPLIVRGHVVVRDMDGEVIEPGRRTFALCRCGYSARKPFCDGSHRKVGFTASGGDERVAG